MAVSVQQFVQCLSDSGLMPAEEVHSFRQAVGAKRRIGDVRSLAREFVRHGKLTEYQASVLQEGKSKGLVLGDYVVLEKIGQGSMGQVFRAVHRRMDRVVAIKVLPPEAMKSAEAVQRFKQEAKVTARLEHAHIVTAYDAGESEGMCFLVMQYIKGQNLDDLVRKKGRLPVARAITFILHAAKGLDHAHRQGVTHRDIKPSNLLLDSHGIVRVLDLGLARLHETAVGGGTTVIRLTLPGQTMGTAYYMSPEQATDTRQADARSDIYSLGCTLFYLLTGEPPYMGNTVAQTLLEHHEAPIPSLRKQRSEIPKQLDSVFQKMLAKKPEDRYQEMSQVIAALEMCVLSGALGSDDRSPSIIAYDDEEDSATMATAHAASGETLVEHVEVVEEPEEAADDDEATSAPAPTGKRAVVLIEDDEPEAEVEEEVEADPEAKLAGSDSGVNRSAAEWVLMMGGSVIVHDGRARKMIKESMRLPDGPLFAETIGLESNKLVADDDLSRFSKLTELNRLLLHGTRISDEGLKHLSRLTALTQLGLGKTRITDDGLEIVAGLLRLKQLSLQSNRITDAGLTHLRRLKKLEKLNLVGTQVSETGVAELQRALPKCEISH
jgi:serine/threonine protein kinase